LGKLQGTHLDGVHEVRLWTEMSWAMGKIKLYLPWWVDISNSKTEKESK
jgi:hypothetical protein